MTDDEAVRVPTGTLTWARERVSMELDEAAIGAKQSAADLQAWEDGEPVAVDVLRELARIYEVPLSAFLRSNLKQEPLPTVDRRKYSGVVNPRTTPELAKALRRSAGLQTLAHRLHDELDARPFEPVPEEIDPDSLAEQERISLGVTVTQQDEWVDEWEAFREWRNAIERRGIYVMQAFMKNSDVRAFSLKGDPPIIVLDRSDWIKARIFSMAHEYAHVITGGSGICIPGYRGAIGVESYCNRFAGSLLVPSETLTAEDTAKEIASGMSATDWRVKHIANRFKVSPAVIWYRLHQVGYISSAVFEASWGDWSNWRPKPTDGGGGQDTAKVVVRDYGVRFPELLLNASRKGVLTAADVTGYLAVRHDTLRSIESEIASRLTP